VIVAVLRQTARAGPAFAPSSYSGRGDVALNRGPTSGMA